MEDTMGQEIRNLEAKLHKLDERVQLLNEGLHFAFASENKFYAFMGTLVDKLICYQESKNAKPTEEL